MGVSVGQQVNGYSPNNEQSRAASQVRHLGRPEKLEPGNDGVIPTAFETTDQVLFLTRLLLEGSFCSFSKCFLQLVVLPFRQEDPVIALRQINLHLVLLLGIPADDLSRFQVNVDEIVRGVLVFLAGHGPFSSSTRI